MAKPQFTDEELEKIKTIVNELKDKIDSTFLLPPDETNIAEIKALREALELMGFTVTVKYNFDVVNMTLDSEVKLWWPKEVN